MPCCDLWVMTPPHLCFLPTLPLPPWWIIQHWQRGGGGSHGYNSTENWTMDHLTSSIPPAHLRGPARCSKHGECFSVNCWFDVASHTLISSHIWRRLSEQSGAITCVTLIYSLSAGSRPFIWENFAGLHSHIATAVPFYSNLQLMEGFKSACWSLF